jgi:hypothetical protein
VVRYSAMASAYCFSMARDPGLNARFKWDSERKVLYEAGLMTRFTELGLPPALLEAIATRGYEEAVQVAVLDEAYRSRPFGFLADRFGQDPGLRDAACAYACASS